MQKFGYQRIYFILKEEDRGFDSGGKPSGHVKIEVRDGEGKLDAFISNLKQKDETIYKLYLVKLLPDRAIAADVGILEENKGSLVKKSSFNAESYLGPGIGANEIDMAIVCAVGNQGKAHAFPLIGFKDKKQPWRNQMDIAISNILYAKVQKYVPEAESIEIRIETEKEEASEPHRTNDIRLRNVDVNVNVTPNDDVKTDVRDDVKPDIDTGVETYAETGPEPDRIVNADVDVKSNNVVDETANIDVKITSNVDANDVNDVNVESNVDSNKEQKDGRKNSEPNIEDDIAKLEELYDQVFERMEPFGRSRTDYTWWKVDNPVRLNDCLFSANISAPMIFNREVIAAHNKYKYMLSGIYKDIGEGKKLLVFGIPGTYNFDPRPYRNMCRWVQAESGTGHPGVFGYWLIYLDPYSKRILLLE